MNELLTLLPWLITMTILIVCSAFFSASEAALFYLQPRERREMKRSGLAGEKSTLALLADPDRLLSAVLFWNLVINVAYFTISSIVAIRIEKMPSLGSTGAWLFALTTLLLIIFFSEMLPKTLAVLKPRMIARLLGIPLAMAVRVVDPLMPFLQSTNTISRRLLWPGFKAEPTMAVTDLERAIELSGTDTAVIKQEQAVLQNIVQLSTIRVEEWMRPRTQFESFQPPVALKDLAGEIPKSGYLLVTESDGGDIARAIRLDNQFHLNDHNIDRSAEPVLYLPWCATVADALEKMSQYDREVNVVVNEFGETIGILTIEDILETVFAYNPSRTARLLDRPAIEQIEDGIWQVAGIMGMRQLAKRLDVEIPTPSSVTVRGIIQESLQRLAESGDQCQWGPFLLDVIEVAQRGVMLVQVKLIDQENQQ